MQPKLAGVYLLAFTYNYLKLSLFYKIQLKVTSLCSLLCIEATWQKHTLEKHRSNGVEKAWDLSFSVFRVCLLSFGEKEMNKYPYTFDKKRSLQMILLCKCIS